MSVVLQCPLCTSSFQVQPQQAGQLVACPSCSQTVSVPESVFENKTPPAATPPTQQNIFGCPFCSGQFGITPQMFGTKVACPHCQKHVAIDAPTANPVETDPTTPTEETIQIPKISTKKKKKQLDMFPPGYKPGKGGEQIEVPVIRKGRKKKKSPEIKLPSTQKEAEPDRPDHSAPTGQPASPAPASSDESASTIPPVVPPAIPPVASSTTAAESTKRQPSGQEQSQKSETKQNPTAGDTSKKKASLPTPSLSKASPSPSAPEFTSPTSSPSPKSDKPTATKPPSTNPTAPTASVASKLPTPSTTQENAKQTAATAKPKQNFQTNSVVPAADRLPKKFTAVDPEALLLNSGAKEEHKVILPDGEGGYQRIDSRVVHVEREGEKVQLFAAPKEQRQKKRLIQNLVAIVVGIAILGLAYWLLM